MGYFMRFIQLHLRDDNMPFWQRIDLIEKIVPLPDATGTRISTERGMQITVRETDTQILTELQKLDNEMSNYVLRRFGGRA